MRAGRSLDDRLAAAEVPRTAPAEACGRPQRRAAAAWADDSWAYTDAKGDVVLDLLERAERWAG